MEIWQLYLLTVLPNLQTFFGVISILGFTYSLTTGVIILGTHSNYAGEVDKKTATEWAKTMKLRLCIVCVFIFGILGTLIPSQEQLLMIVGGYYVTNNKELKEMPNNLFEYINKKLKDAAKEEE